RRDSVLKDSWDIDRDDIGAFKDEQLGTAKAERRGVAGEALRSEEREIGNVVEGDSVPGRYRDETQAGVKHRGSVASGKPPGGLHVVRGVVARGEKVTSAGQDQIATHPERRPGVCPEIRPIVSAGKSQTGHEVETMDARRIQPVVLQGVQTGLGRMERDARILPDRGRLG